jgi:hypothetical protein
MLQGRTQGHNEELVAAGAVAGTVPGIVRIVGWALALGGWPGSGAILPLLLALSVVLALVAAALLALDAGTVTLGSPPAPPAACLPLTGRRTVACLGPGRDEPAFTALEQTAARTRRVWPGAAESLTGRRGKVGRGWAHGRDCSRVVKSWGEACDFPPRRLGLLRSGSGSTDFYPTVYLLPSLLAITKASSARTGVQGQRRDRPMPVWPSWPRESGSLPDRH